MATDQTFVDYVVEQVALGDRLTYKKMFGEFTLYVDNKIVAVACDNSLLVKPSAAAAEIAPGLPERAPYPGAKLCLVADELLDDAELISSLMLGTAALMPMPKPKKASGTSRKTTR
jgi:TfoX/Sxy family transcriptional regulator of competence genes